MPSAYGLHEEASIIATQTLIKDTSLTFETLKSRGGQH
jgi:hypothetical protein